MSADLTTKLSKFLSFVLRHQPESIGLSLDPQGWASVDELLAKSHAAGRGFCHADLLLVVATSEKKRFVLSADGQRVRAAQGHSMAVDLGLAPSEPPTVLYHGTATRFLDSVLTEGLTRRARQQVHLSSDEATAFGVGARHGRPVVLAVAALRMHHRGLSFFRADNGVWLTESVPPEFLAPVRADPAVTTARAARNVAPE